MIVLTTTSDPNFIKLQYQYKNEDIVINKNDILYQSIDSFEKFGDLTGMKIINELSVLKNIQMRIMNMKPFCYVGKDIFVMLNGVDVGGQRKFFKEEFVNGINCKKEGVLII